MRAQPPESVHNGACLSQLLPRANCKICERVFLRAFKESKNISRELFSLRSRPDGPRFEGEDPSSLGQRVDGFPHILSPVGVIWRGPTIPTGGGPS